MLNHTSRMEIQLLENFLSTNKLEKEVLLQTSELGQLRAKSRWVHLSSWKWYREPF